jgi:DNA-binding CsgD family transcriptional regulator
MNHTLTTEDLARFEGASRVLLAPLAAPSVNEWRAEVLRAVRDFLGADAGLFMLSSAPVIHYSESLDEDVLAAYNRPLQGADEEGVKLADPVITRWLVERRKHRQEVFDNAAVDRLLAPFGMVLNDSPLNFEGLWRAGIREQNSMFTGFRGGEAMLQCGFTQPERSRLGAAALPLLHVLLPSFKTALDTLARFGEQRNALDALEEPVAVFGTDGREVHRNPALVSLLQDVGGTEVIDAAMLSLARSFRRLAFRAAGEPRPDPAPPALTVRFPGGTATLRGTLLAEGLFGRGGSVMISVTRGGGPALPKPDVLRSRFGFTKREAEVALLVAEGMSNDAIAERLFISPHTARHHVESVLAKTEVSSRSAIAVRLIAVA